MNFTNPPLSDIKRRFNGKTKVLLYDKLAQYDDIDSLLSPYGHCFILLQSNPEFWSLDMPEEVAWAQCGVLLWQLRWLPWWPDAVCQQRVPCAVWSDIQLHLQVTLHKASFKYTVEFSQYHLQKKDKHVATCGQWCCLFVEYKGPGVDGFYWYIRDFGNPDFDEVCLELFYSKGNSIKRIKLCWHSQKQTHQ